jgi:ABC-type nitrate/sulfonate/bicarbonate transport system substrate-binding protein
MHEATRTHLRVCTFKGLQNLPIYVAKQQGFFATHGLDVEIVYTTGSVAQLSGLVHGEYHLVQTAPDNVINVDNNPAAFGLDSATAPHMVMLFGGSTGPLSLYAWPGITRFSDLQGARIGVDNPSSGFALMLRDMLVRNGLEFEHDYTFVVTGATSARLDTLVDGSVAATILYAPFDLIAAKKGFFRLASSIDYYPAYASLSTAGIQTWVETHADVVIRYIGALRHTLRWIYDPVHAARAQNIMKSEFLPGLDDAIVMQAYTAFTDPVRGFGVEGMLHEAGLQQVIDLRATYGFSAGPPGVPADYQDLRWYHLAEMRKRKR